MNTDDLLNLRRQIDDKTDELNSLLKLARKMEYKHVMFAKSIIDVLLISGYFHSDDREDYISDLYFCTKVDSEVTSRQIKSTMNLFNYFANLSIDFRELYGIDDAIEFSDERIFRFRTDLIKIVNYTVDFNLYESLENVLDYSFWNKNKKKEQFERDFDVDSCTASYYLKFLLNNLISKNSKYGVELGHKLLSFECEVNKSGCKKL